MKFKYGFIAIGVLWINQSAFSFTDADLLHEKLSRIHTLQAQFKQEVLSPQGNVKQRISGEFLLQKPNRFVWQINHPNPQKLISNGRELWIYQPRLRQAIRKPARTSLAKTPIEFLSGSSRELSYYFTIDTMQKGAETSFRLRPKDRKMSVQEIQFNFINNHLRQMYFVDSMGQIVRIQFYGLRENLNVSPGNFQFVPPEGTDVIQGTPRKRHR